MAELFTFNKHSTPTLSVSKVEEITGVVIYYVYTGRNAWHSIWSTKYSAGCMHTNIETAKQYCEKRRNQGTVFNIKQLPALKIKSDNGCAVVTQINTDKPLAGYSVKATRDRSYSSELDNCINKDAKIMETTDSFLPDSRFWNQAPPFYNSIITVYATNPDESFTDLEKSVSLIVKTSYSNGKGYLLGWSSNILKIETNNVIGIANEFA